MDDMKHLSDAGLDEDDVVMVENLDGTLEPMTVAQALSEEDEDIPVEEPKEKRKFRFGFTRR